MINMFETDTFDLITCNPPFFRVKENSKLNESVIKTNARHETLINLEDTFAIKEILIQNGWTLLTGINVMLFSLLHFPCSTTLMTIKKETKSWKWTLLAFALPTICGIIVCMISTGIFNMCRYIL